MKKFKILLNLFFALISAYLLVGIILNSISLSTILNLRKEILNENISTLTRICCYLIFDFILLIFSVFLFVYCNPRLFRISTWTNLSEEWAQNKAERAARKQAKSETDKQKRIEALQAELDALKKDDAPPSEE